MYQLNWHNLPPDMRLGQSPNDTLTLYRGFASPQLDAEHGMLSSAAANGECDSIDRIIQAVDEGDIEYLIGQISNHATDGYAEWKGITTPFVSSADRRSSAENYAKNHGEKVATLAVKANQAMVVPLLPYEVVILGSVGLDQIVRIDDRVTNPTLRITTGPPAFAALPKSF